MSRQAYTAKETLFLSQAQIDRLRDQLTGDLQRQIATAQAQIQRLQEANQDLQWRFDAQVDAYNQVLEQLTEARNQITALQNRIEELMTIQANLQQQYTQLQTQNQTLTTQNQQIQAQYQDLLAVYQEQVAKGTFTGSGRQIAQDTTIQPGTIVWMSFPGGMGSGFTLARFTQDGSSTYQYVEPTPNAYSSMLLYTPQRQLIYITDNSSQVEQRENIASCVIDYNATYNNRIWVFT